MEQQNKQEIEQKMLNIVSLIEKDTKNGEVSVEGVTYYKDFTFKGVNIGGGDLGDLDVYVAKIQNNKDGSTTYELYSGITNGLIATVNSEGKLHFTQDYIESLKEMKLKETVLDRLKEDEFDFELPEELREKDMELGKEKIKEREEEIRGEKTLKSIEESLNLKEDEKIEAYSEINTDQKLTFEKFTNNQEIDTNVRVTQTETLADIIPEFKEKGIVKLGVVYAHGSNGNSGRFNFIGYTQKGEIVPIESLENIDGTTTGQKITSINSYDGSLVEKEQVGGMARINARGGKEYLSVKQGQYGTLEIDYVRREFSKEKGESYLSAPIETHNIRPTTREVRKIMDRTRNPRVDDELDKAKPEIERDGETSIQNIDDTATNDSFGVDDKIELENGETTTYRIEADKANESLPEKAKISPEEFKERYESYSGKTPDEIIAKVHEDIGEEVHKDKDKEEKGPWDSAEERRRPRG